MDDRLHFLFDGNLAEEIRCNDRRHAEDLRQRASVSFRAGDHDVSADRVKSFTFAFGAGLAVGEGPPLSCGGQAILHLFVDSAVAMAERTPSLWGVPREQGRLEFGVGLAANRVYAGGGVPLFFALSADHEKPVLAKSQRLLDRMLESTPFGNRVPVLDDCLDVVQAVTVQAWEFIRLEEDSIATDPFEALFSSPVHDWLVMTLSVGDKRGEEHCGFPSSGRVPLQFFPESADDAGFRVDRQGRLVDGA